MFTSYFGIHKKDFVQTPGEWMFHTNTAPVFTGVITNNLQNFWNPFH